MGKPETVGESPRFGKGVAWSIPDAGLLGSRQDPVGVELLREAQPEVVAAGRLAAGGQPSHVFTNRGGHRGRPVGIDSPEIDDIPFQQTQLDHLSDQRGSEVVEAAAAE